MKGKIKMKTYKTDDIIYYADYCRANNLEDIDDDTAKNWIKNDIKDLMKEDADPKDIAVFFRVSSEEEIAEIMKHNYEIEFSEDSIMIDHDTKFVKGTIFLKV